MTVITKQVTLQLTNGTQNSVGNPNVNACQLTPNRMIIYSTQSTPYTRNLTVMDNPDGIYSATAPTMAYNVFADTNKYAGDGSSVKMERLSNDSFMIMSGTTGNAQFTNTNWTLEVFKIVGTTISRVSVVSLGNLTYQNRTNSKFFQNLAVVTFNDYEVVLSFPQFGTSYNYYPYGMYYYWKLRRGVFNPVNNTWTWDADKISDNTSVSEWGDEGTYYPPNNIQYIDTWAIKNPNGSRMFFAKTSNNRNYSSQSDYSFSGYNMDSIKMAVFTNASTWSGVYSYGNNGSTNSGTMKDAIFPHGDSQISTSNWKNFTFSGSKANPAVLENATALDTRYTYYTHVLPIDNDYFVMIDRRYFIAADTTNTPFRMKIIRRVDGQLIEQSPASSTSITGFKVTVPWCEILWDKGRPWLNENNDIVWWGVSNGKFVINAIKQPPLPPVQ